MREHFLEELQQLNDAVREMAGLVEANMARTSEALQKRDKSLAAAAVEADAAINDMELVVTDMCVALLAREQPVASDLRRVVGCLKAVSDIERIGDYVVHVAKRVRDGLEENLAAYLRDAIPRMMELGLRMFRSSIKALITSDESLARETSALDGEMDSLNKKAYHELLSCIARGEVDIKQSAKYLFLSRFLERLGDHAVHICTWAVFAATGKMEEL